MSFDTASTPITSEVEWALTRLGRYGINSFSSCLTGVQEPSYLVKFPSGIRAREVWGILRAFNIF